MLITQKYHSASEIDPEFIPSLESLLCNCVPSFDLIKNFEENSPKNTHFHYYLFFSDKHNSPIGFTQVAIEQKNSNKKKFNFFKKPEPKSKLATWKVPGCYQEALVVEPRYKTQALYNASKLFQEFNEREDILCQTFRFGQIHEDVTKSFITEFNRPKETIIADTLVKNQSNYQDYLQSLDQTTYKLIRNNWKSLHQNEIHMNGNQDFKELFAYKKDGAKLYKQLKSDFKVKQYTKLNTQYFSLEHNDQLLAIIFLIKGYGHHYFYDYITLDQDIAQEVFHQMAIMNFYEIKDSDRLHLLFNPDNHEYFSKVGFTSRRQVELTYSK